jgi:hypothetical protein
LSVFEKYIGGIASSAIAKRRGLSWEQGYAIYLTTRRILVVRVKTSHSFSWTPNPGALLGTFDTKVTPFIDETPQSIESIEQTKRVFEAPVEMVSSIELKKPGKWFGQGSVRFNLGSGKDVKFGLLGGYGEYYEYQGDKVCDKLAQLFEGMFPGRVKTS